MSAWVWEGQPGDDCRHMIRRWPGALGYQTGQQLDGFAKFVQQLIVIYYHWSGIDRE
jgi:hypothetical protein